MVAEVELVVGLEEVAGGDDEFGLAVALEAGAGHDIEDAIGAVADIGGVAAALDSRCSRCPWVGSAAPRLLAMLVLMIGTPSKSQVTWWPPRMWSMSWVM